MYYKSKQCVKGMRSIDWQVYYSTTLMIISKLSLGTLPSWWLKQPRIIIISRNNLILIEKLEKPTIEYGKDI